MQRVLEKEAYENALSSNVVARNVAARAGDPGSIRPPEEESVSVLDAMTNPQQDRSDELQSLGPSLRARKAAAYAFAAGQAGDRKLADRYLDTAFAAADEAWQSRSRQPSAADVVREVSDAAAQVDSVAALHRAQRLAEPAEQAIGMLAVARVVLSHGL